MKCSLFFVFLFFLYLKWLIIRVDVKKFKKIFVKCLQISKFCVPLQPQSREIGEDSPTDLIKECRLHIAKDLLLTTKKTIDEIVFDSGFSNKVTFFKVFREKYECTPKEFRMKHLEEVQQ